MRDHRDDPTGLSERRLSAAGRASCTRATASERATNSHDRRLAAADDAHGGLLPDRPAGQHLERLVRRASGREALDGTHAPPAPRMRSREPHANASNGNPRRQRLPHEQQRRLLGYLRRDRGELRAHAGTYCRQQQVLPSAGKEWRQPAEHIERPPALLVHGDPGVRHGPARRRDEHEGPGTDFDPDGTTVQVAVKVDGSTSDVFGDASVTMTETARVPSRRGPGRRRCPMGSPSSRPEDRHRPADRPPIDPAGDYNLTATVDGGPSTTPVLITITPAGVCPDGVSGRRTSRPPTSTWRDRAH